MSKNTLIVGVKRQGMEGTELAEDPIIKHIKQLCRFPLT